MPNSSPDASLEKIPRHAPRFMDGNGRWALFTNYHILAGHKLPARKICAASSALPVEFGVKLLRTIYTFSTENWEWARCGIMNILEDVIDGN